MYKRHCQVIVSFKNGEIVKLFVEYDPLESYLWGREIEYSNCPSAELNENGDMLILFGKSSRSFHRTENDYLNFIEGLKAYFPKGINGTLEIELATFGNAGHSCWCPDNGLFVETYVRTKGRLKKYLPLVFNEVTKLEFNFGFGIAGKDELNIATTEDGKLFVQIGESCNFYCKSIKVFEGF